MGDERKGRRKGRERGRREGREGGGGKEEERGLDDFFILTCHSQFHASLWVLGGGWRVWPWRMVQR